MTEQRPATGTPDREEEPEAIAGLMPVRSKGRNRDSRAVGPVSVEKAVAEAELRHAPEDLPESPRPAWREQVATVGAISIGGMLGANARYLVSRWATDHWGAAFPWSTLLINVTGSFVLGFYLTLVTERFSGRSTIRLFVATGFLGAYTTFSTFSYETVRLIQHGDATRALAYVATSLLVGLLAAVVGIVTAHAL
jgi:CrcB protein